MSFETLSLLLSWVELGVLLAILFRLGHTLSSSPVRSASLDERSIIWASVAPLNWALTTISVGRRSRQFPAPGWRLPILRASWVPTIWPACRSEIGDCGLVTRSLALAGDGVSLSVWPCVYWRGLSCSLWRSCSSVAPSRVGCL
jgi:hypothetical protein